MGVPPERSAVIDFVAGLGIARAALGVPLANHSRRQLVVGFWCRSRSQTGDEASRFKVPRPTLCRDSSQLAAGEDPQDGVWSADGKLIYTVNVDGVPNDHPVGNVPVVDAFTGGQTRLVTHNPDVDSASTSLARNADGVTGYIANLPSATLTVLDLAAT